MQLNSRLFTNSFFVLAGTIIAGGVNYVFQMLMGRWLTVADFGTLESLLALFNFFAIPAAAISIVVTHGVATFLAKDNGSSINAFLKKLTRVFTVIGLGLLLFFLASTPIINNFLKLTDNTSYLIFSFSMLFVFTVSIYRGCLNGLQKFKKTSLNIVVESTLKVILAVFLVWFIAGGVNGAVSAWIGASFLAFIFLLWQSKGLLQHSAKTIYLRPYVKFFVFVFLWTLSLTLLQGLDVILVKRFFSAETTGLYASLSLIGKIIFFASSSVGGALFPMATEMFEKGNHGEHRLLLLKALLLVMGIALPGVVIYMLFPNFVITTLFGTRYLVFSSYLPLFALMSTFLSLIQIISTYFLSIKRKWFLIPLIIAVITEIILVYLFHSDILQIIKILMAIQFILIILLFTFFLKNNLQQKSPNEA